MHVYISYVSEDKQIAEDLVAQLKQSGISIWSQNDLLIGEDKTSKIQHKIQTCKALVVIISENTINSRAVESEVRTAERNKKLVAPILYGDLKERDLPLWVGNRNYADARNNRNPIKEIIKALSATDSTTEFSFETNRNKRARQIRSGYLSDQDTQVVIVPSGGRIDNNRIGLNPNSSKYTSKYGLFTSFPDDADRVRQQKLPVSILFENEIPEGVLLIGEYLAADLGLIEGQDYTWDLQISGLNALKVNEIHLELTTETPIDVAVQQLSIAHDLTGRLIWLPDGLNKEEFISIGQEPYRIKEISPLTSGFNTILEIQPSTSLFLFSSGVKSGVDMVILADMSGSMSIDDLPNNSESFLERPRFGFTSQKKRTVERMEALKAALKELLEMRIRLEGRVSRLALVGFNAKPSIKFPKSGVGMESIDGTSNKTVVDEFEAAISLLRPDGGTDIGQALHFAAELLYKYGIPENERLIVLISDGAAWTPKGADSTGEMVTGVEDVIGLMDNLHSAMSIHLHTIGISNLAFFDKWWKLNYPRQQPHEAYIPNHDLLEKLMHVGGGDVSRIGGVEVIKEYFSGLGKGITKKVQCPRGNNIPSFRPHEKHLMQRYNTQKSVVKETDHQFDRRKNLAGKIWELVTDVNQKSEQTIGVLSFNIQGIHGYIDKLGKRTDNTGAFVAFLGYIGPIVNLSNNVQNEVRINAPSIFKYFKKSDDIRGVRAIHRNMIDLKPNQPSPIKAKDFIKDYVNIETISADNVQKWRELQIAILESLKKILEKTIDIYDEMIYEQSSFLENSDLDERIEEEGESDFTFIDF